MEGGCSSFAASLLYAEFSLFRASSAALGVTNRVGGGGLLGRGGNVSQGLKVSLSIPF